MSNPDADMPPQGDPSGGGLFRFLWDTVRRDRMLAIILAAVGVALLMAAYLSRSGATADGLQGILKIMLPTLVVIVILVLVLGSMRNTILGRTFTAMILVYLIAGLKQFLFAGYPPPLPPFYCFVTIQAEGCPGSPKYSHTALANALTEVVEASAPAASGTPLQTVSPGLVFMQFAGNLQRETIVELAQALSAEGWRMQGATRGGERTAAASGLNEIRYFHQEDRLYAEALARSIMDKVDWIPSMEVRDLSRSRYNPEKGQLEIWISR